MKIIFYIFLLVGFVKEINAQTKSSLITATINVSGNCDACKKRIENAADIKGVKRCTWDETTKIATVLFDASKTDLKLIEKAIAASGHETPQELANAQSYKKLPDCCQYKTKTCDKPEKK